jgi:SAM-dependent methyltransferase
MRSALKAVVPENLWQMLKRPYWAAQYWRYRTFGQPYRPAETTKAHARREREGFFDSYCRGKGLDVGYGGDPVVPGVDGWDMENGDATYLKGVADNSYDFVYASHMIEHMADPQVALQNWWRVLKPGGHLLLYLPHRDLYEKRKELPSKWNFDHKHFFLIDRDEPPSTIGIVPLLGRSISGYDLVYIKECKEGWTIPDPDKHSVGEYSIEAVVRKH